MKEKLPSPACNTCTSPIAYLNIEIPANGPVVLDFKHRWMQSIRVMQPVKILLINPPPHRQGCFLLRLTRHGNPAIDLDMRTVDNLPLLLTPNGTDVLKMWNDIHGRLTVENTLPNTCNCRPIY